MNPSYNSGSFSAGGNPGMITSAPDSASTPMQLGSNSKKPKKIILVVAAILIVVLIIVLMVVVMMSGNNGGNNNSQNTAANNEQSQETEEEPVTEYTGEDKDFYQYANYILNGTKETKTIGTYNENKKYAITTAVEEKNTKFFQTANSLWTAFYNRISKDTRFVNDSNIEIAVKAQSLLMDFLTKYVAIKDYSEDEMWEMYAKNGLENTVKTVRAEYEKLQNTTLTEGVAWAKNKADLAEAALRLYDAYNSKGCIKDNDFDQTCIDNNVESLKDLMTKYLEADSNLEGSGVTIENVALTIAKNCFEIRNYLENSSEEK